MTQPNIVFISTDQQRFDTIQAAGYDHVWTPHLDWLCDSGIRFDRAYSDCPVCMPARTTIMNGRHAYNHGVMSNRFLPTAIEPQQSLAGLLTQAGYQTRLIGKTHFGPGRVHQGFEHIEFLADYERNLRQQHPGLNVWNHGIGHNEFAPAVNPLPQNLAQPAWIVDRGLEFLQTRDDSRPFFCWLSTNYPHPPFTPSQELWQLYQQRPMPERHCGEWSQHFNDVPPAMTAVSQELSMTQRFTDAQRQQFSQAYHACISEVDYQLGRFFGGLKEHKLLQNTWIIFTSDHGEMLGDHHLGGKCVPLDAASRIPFIIRPPAGMRDVNESWRGSVNNSMVCLADILPTCASIAGIEPQHQVDGIDLSVTAGAAIPADQQRDAFYHSCMYLHAVRHDGWKLCRETLDGTELLFDNNVDSYDTNNLIADPQHADRVAHLRNLLDAHLSRHGLDAGVADPAVISTTANLPRNTCGGFDSGLAS